jgi:hypothetical protein
MNLHLLYIDPGTGSALFSVVIGLTAAGYFLFQAFYLKVKVLLTGGKAKKGINNKFVIYAEDKRYWVFFQSILDEFEARQTEVLYLTSSEDDPVFTYGYRYIKGKYIGNNNKAFVFLNFLSADIVLATTPDLDVLQWKRSKTVKHYSHFIHAAGGSSMYRLFGLDYFDSVLLSGDCEINEMRTLENIRSLPDKKIAVVGNTYFDLCSEKIKQIPEENNHPYTVLVSPSWGPSSLFKVYGKKLLDPLSETGWRIIIRPHPQSLIVEKPMITEFTVQYKDNSSVEWDYNHENIFAMAKSDVMISDFSGIIYDYVFLFDRPVLINIRGLDLRHLDAHCLKEEPVYLQT